MWPSAPTLVWELTVAVDHTFAVYAGDHAVVVHNQKRCDDAERAAARQERIEELAGDPAHGGAIDDDGRAEAEVGVALEESGAVRGLVRSPSPGAEFIDADGQAWDVKGFRSTVPPRAKGAFTVEKAMDSIREEITARENVMVDTRNMTPEHVQQLQEAVRAEGYEDKVLYWP